MGETAITFTPVYVEKATITSKFFGTKYISLKYFENKEKFIFTKRLKRLDYDNSDCLRKIVCYILTFLNNEK